MVSYTISFQFVPLQAKEIGKYQFKGKWVSFHGERMVELNTFDLKFVLRNGAFVLPPYLEQSVMEF